MLHFTGDDGCFISQESLGETNGDINFTSLNGLWIRCCFAIGLFWARDRSGESSFFIKAPMGRFFLTKFFEWVAYEKIKIDDGKDVEI